MRTRLSCPDRRGGICGAARARGGGPPTNPERGRRCEAAFQYVRGAADAAVKAIQESGGSAAETEQVRARERRASVRPGHRHRERRAR